MSDISNVIVVTGGASGIGLALTRFFAGSSRSACIYVLDIMQHRGQDVIQELSQEFPNTTLRYKYCDIASWKSQEEAFKEIFDEKQAVHTVVANAGISEKGSLLSQDSSRPVKPDLSTLDINLTGTIYTINLADHYIRKTMTDDRRGTSRMGNIICTASVAGLYAFPIAPIYATSKHAIIGLVRSLARPLSEAGIRINALAPNVVETNISASSSLFTAMHLTPMSSVLKAIKEIVNNKDIVGAVALISGEGFVWVEPHPEADGDVRHNIETFWSLGYS